MDILPYLAIVLKAHKEVGIDNFGTFFKIRIPGRYDEQSQSYLPPQYELGFKREVTATGALTQFISRERQVSENTAGYFIGEYGAKLNQFLKEKGELTLSGIGKFTQREFEIAFEADAAIDLGHDFFGLPSVKALPSGTAEIELTPEQDVHEEEVLLVTPETALQTEEEPAETQDPEEEAIEEEIPEEEAISNTETEDLSAINNTFKPETQETPQQEPYIETEETSIEEESGADEVTPNTIAIDAQPVVFDGYENAEEEVPAKNKAVRWLIVIFILIAIGAVALMAKPDLYDRVFSNKPADTVSSFDKNKLKNTKDTLTQDTALTNKVKLIVIDSIDQSQGTVKSDSTTYEIIVTAENSEARVKYVINYYTKKGFTPKVLPGKMMKKISVGTFTSRIAAMDSLKSVQKILKSKAPYVLPLINK